MRCGALRVLLALLATALPAAAQQATVETPEMEAPPPLMPGEGWDGTLRVRYCYSSPPAVPATIVVSTTPESDWYSVQPTPSRFDGTTGGQRCGSRDVAMRITLTRAAPAFEPSNLRITVQATGTGQGRSAQANVPVQATYWAELDVRDPPRVRAERDWGSSDLNLQINVAANGGTRLEILARDPSGRITITSATPGTSAGRGLDDPDPITAKLTVAAGPSAPLGINRVPINISTQYFQRADIFGEATTVFAEIDVVEHTGIPGPEVGLVAGAALAAAILAARRGRS